MPRKANTAGAVVETAPTVETKKKIDPEELINCRSLTNGGLYFTGEKSKIPYAFADYDDVIGVEYRDLAYMVRSHDKTIFDPRMIVTDERFIEEFTELNTLYKSIYDARGLKEVLELPTAQMQRVIATLPTGALENLKGLVATMIDNRSLDSVTKIKVLDEILDTNHLAILAQK